MTPWPNVGIYVPETGERFEVSAPADARARTRLAGIKSSGGTICTFDADYWRDRSQDELVKVIHAGLRARGIL